MTKNNLGPDLRKAIETLHDCTARYMDRIWVVERFKDGTVWEGPVRIFDIEGHPKVSVCYGWSSPVEGSDHRRVYAVLHIPPVESPKDAVMASIRREYTKGA